MGAWVGEVYGAEGGGEGRELCLVYKMKNKSFQLKKMLK